MFKTSIRNKLMVLLLTVTVIPIITSIIITNLYTKTSVTDESIRENMNLLSLGKSNMMNYMDIVNQTSLRVYNDLNSPASLFGIIGRKSGIPAGEIDFTDRSAINSHLLNMYQSFKDIYQIHLQISNRSQSYLLTRRFFRGPELTEYTIPQDVQAKKSHPFLEATHQGHSYLMQWNHSDPKEMVFTLHRPVINTPSDEVIGYLSIDVSAKALYNICRQLYVPDEEMLYIIDRYGNVIFPARQDLSGKPLREQWLNTIVHEQGEAGHFEWKERSFSGIIMYNKMKTNYLDWTIVKLQPYSDLYEGSNQITRINSIIAAVFLVIVVIATLFISVHFTKPIKKLISYINKAQSGNLNMDIEIKGNDEIGVLARRFDAMIQTVNDLINREYRLEIANKTNQLKAMQAQINPHFMNNTLQSIGTLALQLKAPKIYSLIASLGRIMRYNMNTNDTIVPLSFEIQHVKDYLELQQQRFGDKLEVFFDIEEQTNSIPVPKMLLQPLAENYFKHSYEKRSGHGQIRILTSIQKSGFLVISVEDNGSGMPSDQLEQLRLQLNKPLNMLMQGQKSIGLSNVLMRLRLYFNESARMEVDNLQPAGFKVTLWIPAEIDDKGGITL
ncbi:MAG: cache domain-containing sensor histidine kinase [Bacillota bacterium]